MKPPPVDDATLDKLAELAGIPQEKRGAFYSSVRASIGELRRVMDEQEPPVRREPKRPQVRRKPILAALDEYQAAVDKVRELLTSDGAAQSWDHEYARGDVLTFLCGIRGEATDEAMFDGVALLDDLDRAIEKAKPGVVKAFKDKGRQHGVHGNPAIDMFLYSLLHRISTAGGCLETSRSAKSSPTHMIRALEILRPCLPKDFPEAVPWAIEKAGIILVNRDLGGPTGKCAKNGLINRSDVQEYQRK